MSSIPPSLSVTLSAERRSCVLDACLVLSRYGLPLAKRLGDEFNLWLVRELWHVLDNTHTYRARPELLAPDTGLMTNGPDLAGLAQWERVREEKDLAGMKVCWLNDQLGDSLLPSGIDMDVFSRYEALGRSLEARQRHDKGDGNHVGNALDDCFRDAAALCVALAQYKSFILTLMRSTGKKIKSVSSPSEPFICETFRKWGIDVRPIALQREARLEWELISPILARAGVSELMWAGLKPAAVHLFAPRANFMPNLTNEGDGEGGTFGSINAETMEKGSGAPDWWEEALCFWYPLWIS